MSMPSVLVGAAILGIGAVLAMEFGSNAVMGAKKLALDAEREALRRMMLQVVNCDRSMQATTCAAPGQIVPLWRVARNGVVRQVASATNPPTRIGSFAVRAECNADRNGLLLRVARLEPGGTLTSTAVRPEPLTGKHIPWTSPESLLFDGGMEICSRGSTGLQTASSASPLLSTECPPPGVYTGGWCSRPYELQVNFPQPFTRAPAVVVSMATPNPLAGSCPGHMDTIRVEAKDVTTTGFKMVCSASPNDFLCGSPYTAQFLPSTCHYFAVER